MYIANKFYSFVALIFLTCNNSGANSNFFQDIRQLLLFDDELTLTPSHSFSYWQLYFSAHKLEVKYSNFTDNYCAKVCILDSECESWLVIAERVYPCIHLVNSNISIMRNSQLVRMKDTCEIIPTHVIAGRKMYGYQTTYH